MKSSLQLSIRGSGVILLLRLILFNLLHSLTGVSGASGNNLDTVYANVNSTVVNPLVYTRLKYEIDYLQIYRAYQLEFSYEEKELELRVNETLDDGRGGEKTREVVYKYYENEQVDANKITQDELILEALDRTYMTRFIPAYLYNYDNPDDREKASDPKLISKSKCKSHLNYLKRKLNRKASDPIDPELAAFFDSYAKEEPGLLLGNYHWTGNWRHCYTRRVFDKEDPSGVINFNGRYCIASLRSKNWEPIIKAKTDELLRKDNYFKYPEQRYDYARFHRIQVGICLPESCDSRTIDTQRELIRQLTTHKLGPPVNSYQLTDLFCLPDETSELRQITTSGWCLITLGVAWILAILLATFYDNEQPAPTSDHKPHAVAGSKSVKEKLINSMSLKRNYHRLTETKTITVPPGDEGIAVKLIPNDLLFLNSFKVISMPSILFGHVGMLSIMLSRFPLDYSNLQHIPPLNHFNINAVFFVDWYFVVSGFLLSYLSFLGKKIERNTLAQWVYGIFHRYWRLAPIYILLFWFSKTLFEHTGSGPIWDYGTNNMTIRNICHRESWSWTFGMLANFHAIHDECLMPAWYLGNDIQFFIITPFILIALSKKPIMAWIGSIGIIMASVLAGFHRYMTDKRAQHLELLRPSNDCYMRNNWDMHPTYIEPWYRIPSYLIGLLAGHYTYMVLTGQWRSPIYTYGLKSEDKKKGSERIKRLLGAGLCLLGFQIMITMAFASWTLDLLPESIYPQAKLYASMIYATTHTTTAIGVSLACVCLMLGQFPSIKRFLSHPAWSLLSRINFFIFLAQVEVIYWVAQSTERIIDLTPRDMCKNFLLVVSIIYPLSFLVTIFLEQPLVYLEKEFVGTWIQAKFKAAALDQDRKNKKKEDLELNDEKQKDSRSRVCIEW